MELLYNPEDKKTLLHYSGNSTSPDLTMVSSDLYDDSQKTVLEELGSDHRPTLPSVKLKASLYSFISKKFQERIETEMREINTEEPPHRLIKNLLQHYTTKRTRGKQPNFKPFWTKEL